MDIVTEIITALEKEDRVALATIISTSGSTPASPLSKMLVKDGGTVAVGTVGGGCMEADVLDHARAALDSGTAALHSYPLDENHPELGLICGGSIDVLVQPLSRTHLPVFLQLKEALEDGIDCLFATLIDHTDGSSRVAALTGRGERTTEAAVEAALEQLSPLVSGLDADLREAVRFVEEHREARRVRSGDIELILEPMRACPSLVIFGGGHVSKYVSRAAAMAGFRVTVVDDRPDFSNPARFPEAVRTLAVDFSSAFDAIRFTPSTNIVIVTRGHRYDEVVLEQALGTPAGYIGMIGSGRKVALTYDHLMSRGVTVDTLKRVHAPIGVDIGAVTAEEIAISIVAELVSIRRGSSARLRLVSSTMDSFFAERA